MRAEPDEIAEGIAYAVQYYYCIKHGDQYKKLSTEDSTTITPVK